MFNVPTSQAFMGYVADSMGRPLIEATIKITGPNYTETAPTDLAGFGMIYLIEANPSDKCTVLVSAKGYRAIHDTIVVSSNTFARYRMQKVAADKQH
jgi:hypothetical protein